MTFSEQLRTALQTDPDKEIIAYKDLTFTRRDITDIGDRVVSLLTEAGAPPDAAIGIVTRNRPLHGAAIVGLIAREWPLATLYAFQSPQLMAKDVEEARFAAVVADDQDWSPELVDQVRRMGCVGIRLSLEAEEGVRYVEGADRRTLTEYYKIEGEPGLQILSSGTTGKPKRIHFPFRMLERAVETVKAGQMDPSLPPDIATWPFAGIGGLCNLVANIVIGRYKVILDRFNVPEWVEAVKKYQPSFVSGPPAVMQMVVDAGVAPKDLESIRYFYGGSAPMPEELKEALQKTYGITVIWAYGATEFCGTIISWNLKLHEEFGESKKTSMGRPLDGIQIRVTDVETGAPLPTGETGFLEAIVPAVSDDWIRTTDLARIDEDGFVYHCGRGDGAIMRGGFKIIPEDIVDALKKHESVLEAAAVGLDDARVGQTPVAAVQLRSGAQRITPEELTEFLRSHLKSTAIPSQIRIVEELPRNAALKVDRRAVADLFANT